MVFTNVGIQELIYWLNGDTAVAPTHMAVGSGDTAATEDDTALETEEGRYAFDTQTAGTDTVEYNMIVPTTLLNGDTLEEAGVFNASSSGDMFVRFTYSDVVKTNLVEVQYEVTLKIIN